MDSKDTKISRKIYQFPEEETLEEICNFVDPKELCNQLNRLQKEYNERNSSQKIKKTLLTPPIDKENPQKEYYVSCDEKPKCPCYLKYELQSSGVYALTDYELMHSHESLRAYTKLPRNRNTYTVQAKDTIKHCIDQMIMLQYSNSQIHKSVKANYNCTAASISHDKYNVSKQDRGHLWRYLQSLDEYELVENEEGTVAIIVTKKMKTLYQNYCWDTVIFSTFHHIIVNKHLNPSLWLFYGQHKTMALTNLFAIVVCQGEINVEQRKGIFSQVFELLGRKPATIISDGQDWVREATSAEDTPNCLLSCQTVIAYLPNNNAKLTILQILQLLRTTDPDFYNKRFSECKDDTLDWPMIHSNCFVKQHPQMHIGLVMTEFCLQRRVRKEIMSYLKSSSTINVIIKATLHCFNMYNIFTCFPPLSIESYITKQLQAKLQYFHKVATMLPQQCQVKNCIQVVAPEVALILLDHIAACLIINLECKDSYNGYYYQVVSSGTMQRFPWIIFCKHQNNKPLWNCDCGYYSKTGLPCPHQIKVCIMEHQSILKKIDQFWKLAQVVPKPSQLEQTKKVIKIKEEISLTDSKVEHTD